MTSCYETNAALAHFPAGFAFAVFQPDADGCQSVADAGSWGLFDFPVSGAAKCGRVLDEMAT
jgi:hypothetical protein